MVVTNWIISSCSTYKQKVELCKCFGSENDVKEILQKMFDKQVSEWKEKHGDNVDRILVTDTRDMPDFDGSPVEGYLELCLHKGRCEQIFYSAYRLDKIEECTDI